VRYPRGACAGVAIEAGLTEWPWGKGELRREAGAAPAGPKSRGPRIAILAFGTLLYAALAAAEKLDASVANMRFVKPLDTELVLELARTHDAFVTVEEGCVMGGAGSAVLEALQAARIEMPVLQLGLPDSFVEHGDPARLLALAGLDAAGIERQIVARFGVRPALLRPAANG
jgi:1-deoxy-D-xylulose-5-phosphate synthase